MSQGMFKSNGEPPIMAVGFPEVHSVGVNLKFLVCMRMLDGDEGEDPFKPNGSRFRSQPV